MCSHSDKIGLFVDSTIESNQIWIGVNTGVIYWIGILDLLGLTTVEEITAWLAENEVTIYHIGKTATETSISLPEILTKYGTNIISVGSTIQPSSAVYQYYKGGKSE